MHNNIKPDALLHYRAPRRIPDSATIQRSCNMHYSPLHNQPSAYIHKLLLSSSLSNNTKIEPHCITHHQHNSDHDVIQGQRERDARPPTNVQHQHRHRPHYEAMVRIISSRTMSHYNPCKIKHLRR